MEASVGKALVINAPDLWNTDSGQPSIFLAGSVQSGDWRAYVAKELSQFPLIILNPARPDWDDTWVERAADPRFREQVKWELYGLEHASLVMVYFDPASKSPISLMELGMMVHTNRVMVACPEGFWKKGNVEVVCGRHNIPLFESINEMVDKVKTMFDSHYSRISTED